MPRVKVGKPRQRRNLVCFMKKRTERGSGCKGNRQSKRGRGILGTVLGKIGKVVTKETVKRVATKAAQAAAETAAKKVAEAAFNRFGARRKKRGQGLAGGLGGVLLGMYPQATENFMSGARNRANENAERIKRLYYYNHAR